MAKPSPAQSAAPTETAKAVDEPDKTSALLSANESLRQGEASSEVLERGSETIGSIINIKV